VHSLFEERGFTLVEILVATVILSVGLLGIAGFTTAVMRGNAFSNRMTTAVMLAQEKMEDVRRVGYSGMPSGDETITEDYGFIANYAPYKRVTFTDAESPAAGMKRVTVTVYWDSDIHKVALATIVAR
jgi:prepilin-type N-terminal cleavage/methylation domain-containing protein